LKKIGENAKRRDKREDMKRRILFVILLAIVLALILKYGANATPLARQAAAMT